MTKSFVKCRGDIQHCKKEQVIAWCKKIYPSKYAFCMEFKKSNNKQHFHIMGETKYHPDTVRRKFKKEFNLNLKDGSDKYCKIVKDKIACINYIMKDGEYTLHNITADELLEVEIYNDKLQTEMSLKTLKDKCLFHLNNLEREDILLLSLNGDIMNEILEWFQKKGLKYPSVWWLKSTMIEYIMNRKQNRDTNKSNLMKLYGINDPFLKP